MAPSTRPRIPKTDSPLWRFLPAGVLAAVAVVTGGVLGFLIGFTAVLIAIDRMLDRVLEKVGASSLEAEHVYQRLSRERSRARIERRLRQRAPESDDLAYLPEDTGWVAVARRRTLGVESIPVESIVGTVDPHKATTFDRAFRPPDFSRGRWTLMFRAARRGARLPPISVYRVAEQHFVRDGHHRVSVARALGADAIDAEVTELEPASPPAPARG